MNRRPRLVAATRIAVLCGVLAMMQALPHSQAAPSDELEQLISTARQDINRYWAGQVTNYRPPADVVMVRAPADTDCGRVTEPNAFYCPPTNKIYWERGFFATELRIGDFAPVFILAHEWGHLVQRQLGFTRSADGLMSVQLELQADCLAGTYAADARRRNVVEPGDDDEAALSLRKAGDGFDLPWFDTEAHGSSGQRIDAFTWGFEGRNCTTDPFFAMLRTRGIDPTRVPQTQAPQQGSLDTLLPRQAGRFTLVSVKRVQATGATDAREGVYRASDGAEVNLSVMAYPNQQFAADVREAAIELIKARGFREVRRTDLVSAPGGQTPIGAVIVLQGALEVVVWSNLHVEATAHGPYNVTLELYDALPF